MPLEVLRYVVLVAEHGSSLAASQIVNLTPSSLSRKIALLESELGVVLFDRHSRGMRLTPTGHLVVEAARQMLHRMDRLAADIDEVESEGHGTVRIHVSQSLVERFLMPCLIRMAKSYPLMRTQLHIAAGRQAERALVHDLADFALVVTAPDHPDIEIVAERPNRIVAVVGESHPLAGASSINIAELVALPFAAMPPSYTSRVAFNSIVPNQHRDGQPHMTANSIPALKAYARSGIGIAVMPEVAVWEEDRDGDLIPIAISGLDDSSTRMCLCRRKSRTLGPAAERFLTALVAEFQLASPSAMPPDRGNGAGRPSEGGRVTLKSRAAAE
ncbi:LysR family transcriptional regulator [Pseudotabrizicola formosa]|uniref:LysR family transcriptional regulator n=1 Tax=Pseudotabrizicola formosa TaxID=2030009 RepID=UPI00143CE3FB|nr:LysR family transcriptional regulator [Pseudotabrizicola formosa]